MVDLIGWAASRQVVLRAFDLASLFCAVSVGRVSFEESVAEMVAAPSVHVTPLVRDETVWVVRFDRFGL